MTAGFPPAEAPAADRARGHRRGEQGYNLVVLAVAITLLNILLAAALPLWSQAIRHEKEEELIFRGLQYAEAIRVFRLRYQRLPSTLDELIKVKPRCIRQLWKDPMTSDGKWALIIQGQDNAPLQAQPPRGQAAIRPDNPPDANSPTSPGQDQQGVVAVGPIAGVRSRSTQKSIEIWNGQQEYDLWRFTVDLIQGGARATIPGVSAGGPGGGFADPRWIGRPMPGTFSGGTFPGGPPRSPGGAGGGASGGPTGKPGGPTH